MRTLATTASWFVVAVLPTFGPTAHAEMPRPPREAFEACRDKREGDACDVTFRGRTLSGQCVALGEALACKPEGPPPVDAPR